MESKLIKEFNLPSYIKGKSFAEASSAIEKKFENRMDAAAMETKDELMGRLAKAQEYVKMQESLKANAAEVPDMMGGQVPEGFEEFAPQPQQGQMADGGWADMDGNEKAGAVAGMAGTALELGQGAFGDTGIDTTGASGRGEAGSMGGAIAGGAVKGAAAGAALGPWGAAVGGVVGGALGGIAGGKAKKDQLEANLNVGYKEHNAFTNDFAYGGFTDPRKKVKAVDTTNINNGIINDSIYPIAPVGGVENLAPKGIETPKRDGSDQAAYLDSVKYAGRKPATPGEPYNHSASAAGIFDNEQTQVPRKVVPKKPSIGEPYNHTGAVAGIFDNEKTQVPRDPGYDFYNDPDKVLKGQAQVAEMKDYLTSKEGIGTPKAKAEGTSTGNVEATPAQRAKIKALEMKYGKIPMDSLQDRAKADSASFAKQFEQTKVRDARMQELFGEHADKKPKSGLDLAKLSEYAPAAMNAFQLANLKKPTRESLDRLDTRYKTDYVDEKALETRVQNEHNNVSRALAGASNGSMGALRANLLGAGKNRGEATNDAFLKADDINRQEDRTAQQFNSRNDSINLQQSNREKENSARDSAAYENNKSMLQSTLAENIGGIGKEANDRSTIAKMFGYDVKGDYVVGKDGKKKSWKAFQEEIRQYQKNSKS